MKQILRYLKPYLGKLLAATVLIALSTLCDLLLPTIMNDILNNGVRQSDFAYIVRCCVWMLAVAAAALREMYRQVGGTELNEDGQMMQGMLVRHLVLPGYLSNTLAALDTIAALFPARNVSVSLMSQYVPMGNLPAPLDRGITREEYDGALSWMELCGLTGYWQDFSSATTEYLPDFGDKGLLYSG